MSTDVVMETIVALSLNASRIPHHLSLLLLLLLLLLWLPGSKTIHTAAFLYIVRVVLAAFSC